MFGKNAGNFQYSVHPCQHWGDWKRWNGKLETVKKYRSEHQSVCQWSAAIVHDDDILTYTCIVATCFIFDSSFINHNLAW